MPDSSDLKAVLTELPLKDAYNDLIHPAASAVGQTLSLPFRAVNVLLAPLTKWVLQGEEKLNAVSQLVAEKVADVPREKLVPPESYVAVPAMQAISYSLDNSELRDLYANLLAKAINTDTRQLVHPAYVEMIKQMSPLDALLLRQIKVKALSSLALCDVRWQEKAAPLSTRLPTFRFIRNGIDLMTNLISISMPGVDAGDLSTSIENLARLRLVELDRQRCLIDEEEYVYFEHCPAVDSLRDTDYSYRLVPEENKTPDEYELALLKGLCLVTNLGAQFSDICVSDPE